MNIAQLSWSMKHGMLEQEVKKQAAPTETLTLPDL